MFNLNPHQQRIQQEDALKHIYKCEHQGSPATEESLRGILKCNSRRILDLIADMGRRGLVRVSSQGFLLTPKGKAWALQVIRAHRLWESHLAEEVGVPLSEIHRQAEIKEHELTREQVNQLEAQLGYPLHDPHGDPIPSAEHDLEERALVNLLDWPTGKLARIAHIEDEPPDILTQILSEGLLVDTYLKVLESNDRGVHLSTSVHECWLAPIVAANVFVENAPDWVKETEAERLTVLHQGEKGKVLSLLIQGLARRRLLDLGLVPGAVVEAEMPSALKEPMAYMVRGTMIVLRKDQADQILIQRMDDHEDA